MPPRFVEVGADDTVFAQLEHAARASFLKMLERALNITHTTHRAARSGFVEATKQFADELSPPLTAVYLFLLGATMLAAREVFMQCTTRSVLRRYGHHAPSRRDHVD